jgi:hypothetical protein
MYEKFLNMKKPQCSKFEIPGVSGRMGEKKILGYR